jgi:hypothetical protein
MFSTIAFAIAALAVVACAWRVWRLRRIALRGREDVAEIAALSKLEGSLVSVMGTLEGGEISTTFGPGIDLIEDAHPDAVSARGETLCVAQGTKKLPLVGEVQVILGAREERRGRSCVRRVGPGTKVLARGTVTRLEDGAYRDAEARYCLAARPEGAWAARPVTVAAVKRDRAPVVFAFLALVAGVTGLMWRAAEQTLPHEAPRNTCGADILAMLDRNDIFGADDARRTCDNPRAAAESLWSVGRIDEAQAAFRQARAADPSAPVTLSELEATLVSQPREVTRGLFDRAQKDWYRGPDDPAQRTLACIAGPGPTPWDGCLPGADVQLTSVPFGFGNPVAAVTDTYRFARQLPAHKRSWDDPYGERCMLVGCRAAKSASLALLAGIAGDGSRAAVAFASIDALLAEYIAAGGNRQGEYGITSEALLAQDAFAVAAVAAWLVHDNAHVERYLAHAEAHAGDTLEQHLALARGTQVGPYGDASKWSNVDIELLGLADHEDPAAFVQRLKDLRYTLPLRVASLLAPRPRLHAAARAWIEGEFVPTCRGCGLFELMDKTSRRREAARAVGAVELERKLGEVSRRAGEAWMRDASRDALWTLELLYRPEQ